MQRPATFVKILRDATSIGIGVATYGVSFGALGVTAGLSPLQTMALSTIMFTGASQFALVGVVGAGGSAATAIAAALLLGSRNSAYAVRMNELLQVRGWRRLAAAHLTIDESTAMALAHEVQDDGSSGGKWAFWLTGLSVFIWWNLATAAGALGANLAGDPRTLGLDSAIAAGFLALLWPQLRDRRLWAMGLVCAVVALTAVPLVPPGLPILLGGAAAVLFTFVWRERA